MANENITRVLSLAAVIAAVSGKSGGGGRLPSEYQEVEYIETDGDAYINTGYQFSGTAKVELRSYRPSGYWFIFGAADSSPLRLQIYSQNDLDVYCAGPGASDYHSATLPYSSVTSSFGNDMHIFCVFKASQIAAVDANYMIRGNKNEGEDLSITKPAYLFKFNHYNSETIRACANGTRCYLLRIWDGANYTLVRDLVPCRRKSDSVIGMYDLVNDQFYTNAAQIGNFSAGGDV